MLRVKDFNLLSYVTTDCCLDRRVYQQMKRIAGVRKAIHFRIYHYWKPANIVDYGTMFLAIVLIELQNPKLEHRHKQKYLSEAKEVFHSLPEASREEVEKYLETIIFGRN